MNKVDETGASDKPCSTISDLSDVTANSRRAAGTLASIRCKQYLTSTEKSSDADDDETASIHSNYSDSLKPKRRRKNRFFCYKCNKGFVRSVTYNKHIAGIPQFCAKYKKCPYEGCTVKSIDSSKKYNAHIRAHLNKLLLSSTLSTGKAEMDNKRGGTNLKDVGTSTEDSISKEESNDYTSSTLPHSHSPPKIARMLSIEYANKSTDTTGCVQFADASTQTVMSNVPGAGILADSAATLSDVESLLGDYLPGGVTGSEFGDIPDDNNDADSSLAHIDKQLVIWTRPTSCVESVSPSLPVSTHTRFPEEVEYRRENSEIETEPTGNQSGELNSGDNASLPVFPATLVHGTVPMSVEGGSANTQETPDQASHNENEGALTGSRNVIVPQDAEISNDTSNAAKMAAIVDKQNNPTLKPNDVVLRVIPNMNITSTATMKRPSLNEDDHEIQPGDNESREAEAYNASKLSHGETTEVRDKFESHENNNNKATGSILYGKISGAEEGLEDNKPPFANEPIVPAKAFTMRNYFTSDTSSYTRKQEVVMENVFTKYIPSRSITTPNARPVVYVQNVFINEQKPTNSRSRDEEKLEQI